MSSRTSKANVPLSLASYKISKRTTTASSSGGHSPTSVGSGSPEPGQGTPRLSPLSVSYERPRKDRIQIHVLENNSVSDKNEGSIRESLTLRRTRSIEVPAEGELLNQTDLVSQRLRPTAYIGNNAVALTPVVASPGPSPKHHALKKAGRDRPSWSRTTSGGVWYQRKVGSSSQDNSSTRSIRSEEVRTDERITTSLQVSPLKPPPWPVKPESSSPPHEVTIQDHFSDPSSHLSQENSIDAEDNKKRKHSIDARKIFSAPFIVVRKALGLQKATKHSPKPINTSATGSLQAKGHRTLLKRDDTAAILARVSALLESHGLSVGRTRLRAWTHRSAASTSSSEPTNDGHQASPRLTFFRRRSHDHNDATSSILALHMGPTPLHSPSELATYKIKRSASAETEEFLKIDISIRGGTSYLPSEARRIHTPPLPEESGSGPRRGFFFDHNAPNLSPTPVCMPDTNKSQGSGVSQKDFAHISSSQHSVVPKDNHIPARAHSARRPRSDSRPLHRPAHAKTNDWYETKLADIDSKSDNTEVMALNLTESQQHQKRNECQATLAEIKRREYEAQLNYNIPEHLPNSPLCPRNPKYWRVVKNTGSQFRGCWMHGYGEYLPGEIPGPK